MSTPTRITARELFDQLDQRLGLRWVAGHHGETRVLESVSHLARRPALAGYLNTIHANKVQIVGSEELDYLDDLEPRQRSDFLARIVNETPLAMVITKGREAPDDLLAAANASDTPLWVSSQRGHELLTYFQYHLARALAPRTTLHGVFMEVHSIGVLITGDSGLGKSELALELVTRGHRLVADDAPEFTQIAPDMLDGACPEMLQDLLEVRGIGILNIREMYGDTAVKRNKYLRLILHLQRQDATAIGQGHELDRLFGDVGMRKVMDLDVPQITLPVAAGRNLAVLAEAAVRAHVLKSRGFDAAQAFMERQAHQMRRARLS
ncbi:MAG TPA: HPr(Ser) kinase/phosphatase [Chiayiivirga sp.]|nr:HPr(Ser) kinase/phosphatase [Chiayiivirga sp.]